jgi:uncharacterized protein (TIGR02145 family)
MFKNQKSVFQKAANGFSIALCALVITLPSCKKVEEVVVVPEPTTVTDIDGNVYPILKIGSQTWTTINLKTTRYNDGTAIPTGLNDADWAIGATGAYAIYDNDPANNTNYGKLYNWYAVNTGKLAPTGWHIPSRAEWTALTDYLGSSNGGKMKSTSSLWAAPNLGADNSSGFSGLPGGYRGSTGGFGTINNIGYWWASSERNATQGDYLKLDRNFDVAFANGTTKQFGYSVRCVKD